MGCVEDVEPVHRHTGEDLTLVWDVLVKDHIKRRDAVAGDDKEVLIIDSEDLAHLA